MNKRIINFLFSITIILTITITNVFAVPSLNGLSEEEQIQLIDNELSEAIIKNDLLELEIKNNEMEIKDKQLNIYLLQKKYQNQKKQSNYVNNSGLRTGAKKDDGLKIFELLLNSRNIDDFFKTIEINKTIKLKNNKSSKILLIQKDSLTELQESLIKQQEKLIIDKKNLIVERTKLNELKIIAEDSIKNRPKVNMGVIPPPDTSSIASGTAKDIINESYKYLGVPYLWGGTTPSGFDCSGFAQYVYKKIGVNLPRTAGSQQSYGKNISSTDIQPGDLLFFGQPAHHVAIYIGDGKYIHSPQSGDVVKIVPVNWSKINSVSRVLN